MTILNKIRNRITTKCRGVKDNLRYEHFGRRSRIIKPMRIRGKRRISIGNYVSIMNGARIEAIHMWRGRTLNGRLSIGDGTSFQQCCHIIAANSIKIGSECVFSAFVYIADCAHSYDPFDNIMDSPLDIKSVSIGNHCFVGIGSCIMPGVNLGDNVVIGANSVVTQDIPENCMAVGSPAQIIKKWDFERNEWRSI
jgi:acetyltransferase-like isoleucine patch superfamily enzyme|nr:acyltransferase [uncultured Acetatifactor sp.]